MTKRHMCFIFVISAFPLFNTVYAESKKVVAENQEHDRLFAKSIIDKLKRTLMNSGLSTEDKISRLKIIFKEDFDTEYIKNRSISKIKRASKLTLSQEIEVKNAIMKYLFYKYVKITSDYKNVDVNIMSMRKVNNVTVTHCEIISRGKKMNCKFQISNKGDTRKVQGIIFEDIDLTNPDGFYKKYNDDCKKDTNELVRQLTAMSK